MCDFKVYMFEFMLIDLHWICILLWLASLTWCCVFVTHPGGAVLLQLIHSHAVLYPVVSEHRCLFVCFSVDEWLFFSC